MAVVERFIQVPICPKKVIHTLRRAASMAAPAPL